MQTSSYEKHLRFVQELRSDMQDTHARRWINPKKSENESWTLDVEKFRAALLESLGEENLDESSDS